MAAPKNLSPINQNDYEWRRDPLGKIGEWITSHGGKIPFSDDYLSETEPAPTIPDQPVQPQPSLISQAFGGYRALQSAAEKQLAAGEGVPPMLARPAPLPSPLAAQAAPALRAATARYTPQAPALPAELSASSGYSSAYDAAVASGRFTPQQLQAAEASRAKYAGTPLGLQGEALRIGSEGTLADLTANIAEQRALATAQERADAASANAAVVDEEQAKRFESMRAEFDESQNKRLADMDELRADIAKTKIDPSQYWSKGSGFGQALSLLSVAIGGFAKGWSGGRLENTGLKMLDQAIDRDIAAQRDNLTTKRGLLAESQSVFSMARQRFGDDQAAAEFTKARQNEMLKNAAARYQGEARTEAMRANAAKLEQHFGLEERRSDNTVQQLYAQAEAARLRAAAGAAAGAASAEEREYDRQLKRKKSEAELDKTKAETEKLQSEARGVGNARKTQGVVSFGGVDYIVPKEAARDLQVSAGAAESTQSMVDSLIELGGSNKYYDVVDSPQYATGQMLIGNLSAAVAKNMAGGFNPPAGIEEKASKMVGVVPRLDMNQKAWQAGLRSIPEVSAANVKAQLKAAGAVRVDGKERKTYPMYESE